MHYQFSETTIQDGCTMETYQIRWKEEMQIPCVREREYKAWCRYQICYQHQRKDGAHRTLTLYCMHYQQIARNCPKFYRLTLCELSVRSPSVMFSRFICILDTLSPDNHETASLGRSPNIFCYRTSVLWMPTLVVMSLLKNHDGSQKVHLYLLTVQW